MTSLKLTSCLAENSDFICQAIADYISARLPWPAEFINTIPWTEREDLLTTGEIDIGWICGLLYIWKKMHAQAPLELLAAPVMRFKHYDDRPVYFSDVIVQRDSPFQTFADLRGATWAYNEPGSYSGYYLVRYHLAMLGELRGYFGRVVQSGAHQVSLQMVLTRQVDAAAIDSTALDLALSQTPGLRSQLRVVERLGPSPIPPWVISKSLPQPLRETVRHLLLAMHHDPQGQEVLAASHLARFVKVADNDYEVIRQAAHIAEQARL